jgi:hypothetical protein
MKREGMKRKEAEKEEKEEERGKKQRRRNLKIIAKTILLPSSPLCVLRALRGKFLFPLRPSR